jgi:hypothetical protein
MPECGHYQTELERWIYREREEEFGETAERIGQQDKIDAIQADDQR